MSVITQSYRRLDRSLRFSFRFSHQHITLFDRRGLEMKPLPTQELGDFRPEERSGFWVEVQDGRGRALYRRIMPHPLLGRSEAPGHETPRTVIWAHERGAFSVVVPNLSDGAELVLVGSPIDRPDVPQPAAEILRVALRERGTPPGQEPGDPGDGHEHP